jgi:hypothetical protein
MSELTAAEIEAKKQEYEEMIAKGKALAEELAANGIEVVAEGKPWYESKMFWVNALALGGIGLTLAGVAPEEASVIISGAAAIVTIVLRSRAKQQPLTIG